MKTTILPTTKALIKGLVNTAMLIGITMTSFSAYAQNKFPATGNVGIGTTSPSESLQVKGGSIRLGSSATQADRDLSLLKIGDGDNVKIGEWELDNRLSFYSSNGYIFNGGNVGIGEEPSTSNTLQVYGTIGISPKRLNPMANRATLNVGAFSINNTNSPSGQNFSISNGGGTLLFIAGNGNVGIGTTTSPLYTTYKFSVAGSIRAQEIVCETGWADFVFEENYKLRDLLEVESFIKKNKHLPEIPSAQEVETNGVRMAEMEAKLLQKVEELTLYAIEAKKEIESLKAIIAEMKGNKNQTK